MSRFQGIFIFFFFFLLLCSGVELSSRRQPMGSCYQKAPYLECTHIQYARYSKSGKVSALKGRLINVENICRAMLCCTIPFYVTVVDNFIARFYEKH